MTTIRNVLVAYLTEAGIFHRQSEDSAVILADLELRTGNALLVCSCCEEAHQLVLRVLFPFRAPPHHQAKVAEFITRVNSLLNLGCFEMDYSDGRLGFRIGVDVEDDRLTPALVRNLTGCALAMTDHFYAPAAAVAMGGMPPMQALEMTRDRAPRTPGGSSPELGGELPVGLRDRLN